MTQEAIKPSHKPIKDYYAALEALRASGGTRETELRAAFHDLLSKLARQRGLLFMAERSITHDGHRITPDGTLLDGVISRGHWEAKDGNDNLEAEIKKKRAKGYPLDNIIFEDTNQAILFEYGAEQKPRDMGDAVQLCDLLNRFFAHEEPVQQTFRQAVTRFKEDVPKLARGLQDELAKAHKGNTAFKKAFGDFFDLCKSSLNPSITQGTVDEMLVQHLLTERIFRKVFNQDDFVSRNVIAAEVEKVISALKAQEFDRSKFLKDLDYFYKAIEQQAAELEDFSEKQEFLNTVYERFFQGYSVKVADTHGIVYTPQAIVDFMCASVDEVLQTEFGTTLGGKHVNILDPCTGTGNFIVNLIRRIPRGDLERVYKHQLFANEIMLLPYYIAALNIEHAYWERTGEYESFEGLCFVDTLELAEDKQRDLFMTRENSKRVERQRKAPITVIIGNPPYNAHQESENDANKNRKYKVIDKRIKETYSADSKATNKNALSDAYVKFFRWAVDRLVDDKGKEVDGIVCYVSNNSFVDQVAFDGMRKHLLKDFTHIYHVDLHGNVRQNPKLSGTTHNVFGIQVGVGITVAVRSKKHKGGAIDYVRVAEDWRKEQKYAWLEENQDVGKVTWRRLSANSSGHWLVSDAQGEFDKFISIANKDAKQTETLDTTTLFKTYGRGVATSRDEIVYDFQREPLVKRTKAFINEYNAEVDRYKRITDKIKTTADDFVKYDNIKWSRDLKQDMTRGNSAKFTDDKVRTALYRPFCQRSLFFDRILNEEVYVFPRIFPTPATERDNRIIISSDLAYRAPGYSALISNRIADLHLCASVDAHQCFPVYVYDEDGKNRRENITDWALKTFREAYGDKAISKWDIFHYVYAMLHHRGYREKFKDCLKRELPRVPFAGFVGATHGSPAKKGKGRASHGSPLQDFKAFVAAGEKLAKLHLDYEKAEPWALMEGIKDGPENKLWRVEKMRLSKDKKSLTVNEWITLEGIPERCFEYRLGNRSALDWVIDQYQVSEDKKSGICSDPNREDDPEYIVRLVKQVIRVSMESLDIIDSLPASYGGPLPRLAGEPSLARLPA